MVKLRYRRQLRLGPLRANITQQGLSSLGFKLGPFSGNTRRPDTLRTDLPGGFHAEAQPLGRRTGRGRRSTAQPLASLGKLLLGAAMFITLTVAALWVGWELGLIQHLLQAAWDAASGAFCTGITADNCGRAVQ